MHQLMQLDKDEIDAAHWVQAYKVCIIAMRLVIDMNEELARMSDVKCKWATNGILHLLPLPTAMA